MKSKNKFALFNRFEIEMTVAQALSCAHSGDCDADVEVIAPQITRPANCTPEALAAELKEYGAWDENELKNDGQNWRRIVWVAAGNIKDEI